MRALRDLLSSYLPVDDTEAVDVARLRDAARRDDVVSRHQLLHVTGSALVVHRPSRSVLLRWHTRMERWMQVGGHFDPGETDPLDVALREATEETGLTDLRPAGAAHPVHIAVVPVPAHGDERAHEHGDIRYVFVTDHRDGVAPESAAAPLRWVPVDAAHNEITEPNLLTFLSRALRTAGLGAVDPT